MAVLKVLTYPSPILKQISQPVAEVDDHIRQIFDDMLETMIHDEGCGLAAVQVGILKRMLICDFSETSKPEPIFMVNPEVLSTSKETDCRTEYCLSLPSAGVEVERPTEITIKFLDYHGKEQVMELVDFHARMFCHEFDHLNGIITLDHTTPLKRDIAARKILKYKKAQKL